MAVVTALVGSTAVVIVVAPCVGVVVTSTVMVVVTLAVVITLVITVVAPPTWSIPAQVLVPMIVITMIVSVPIAMLIAMMFVLLFTTVIRIFEPFLLSLLQLLHLALLLILQLVKNCFHVLKLISQFLQRSLTIFCVRVVLITFPFNHVMKDVHIILGRCNIPLRCVGYPFAVVDAGIVTGNCVVGGIGGVLVDDHRPASIDACRWR